MSTWVHAHTYTKPRIVKVIAEKGFVVNLIFHDLKTLACAGLGTDYSV